MAGTRETDDDESTRVDPPKKKKVEADDDDEATKATGTPKMAAATKRILEESQRLNRQPEQKPKKKVHPLVAVGVVLGTLLVILLIVSWLTAPSAEDQAATQPKGIHKLLDTVTQP